MRYIVTNKALNKLTRITVRLTPHLELELLVISEDLNLTRSYLIRRMIDNFIDGYYNCKDNEIKR